MSPSIVSIQTHDIRFPTSRELDGSDAMNPDPNYSAAYVIVRTDAGDGHEGHGFAFTIGRGNDLQAAAIAGLAPLVEGLPLDDTLADMGGFARRLTHDSQLRWLGPEKGVIHMAAGALINAVWDLAAKRAGQPLWQLLAGMSPEQIVDLVDFRYLSDALTRDEALSILRSSLPGRTDREAHLRAHGYPAYTTSPGWLGYDDDKLARLCNQALLDGFDHIKLKVGADLDDDIRRLRIAREICGPSVRIGVDANQRWDTDEAIGWIRALAPFDPCWVEEPTSPDDVLAHADIARAVAPVKIATGEHAANRVMVKQLLRAEAIGVLQIDATRVAGVNENIANLLLAAKFGVPVCPHAGGVGLCELVQHLSMFDYLAVSASLDGRATEYVDHLHQHFADPVRVSSGRYQVPLAPGFSSTIRPATLATNAYPHGPAWTPAPAL